MDQCPHCGVDMLVLCPQEESSDCNQLVKWTHYQKVVAGKTKQGKDFKVLRLQYKQTIARQFRQYFRPRLTQFVTHNFISKWEEEQFRVSLFTFPPQPIVSVVDFAKN